MPICFTDPEEPLYVTTVDDDNESNEAEDEEDDANSRVSASDFEGNLSDIPKRMLFGLEECGAIFVLSSDHGKFVRICGCKAQECHREGHRTTRLTGEGLGKPGSYETVRSRKFVDGKLETWIPVEEYEADLQAAKAKQKQDLFEAANFLKARSPASSKATSPTGSEDAAYASAFEESYVKHWETKELVPSPMASNAKPAFKTENRKPDIPQALLKAPLDTKPKHDIEENFVSPEGRRSQGDRKEKESMVVETMMDLMAGVRDSLKEVAGGMQALQQGQAMSKANGPPKESIPRGAVYAAKTSEGMGQPLTGMSKMGSNQGPGDFLRDGRAGAGEWYAVIKGKAGASGVFDNYEEAKGLVYRISGATWKKFKYYEDAWVYVQDHMQETSEEESGWFYGVANGRDDFNGVLIDYPSAKTLVDRVSGATWKKFRTHEEAFAFVQEQRARSPGKSRSPSRRERREMGGGSSEPQPRPLESFYILPDSFQFLVESV